MDFINSALQFIGIRRKPPELSEFQKRKLVHEFKTFFDINKDGRLQWKDFEMARDYVCLKSGWTANSKQGTHCRTLFIDLWRNLQDVADNDIDGEITVDEWFRMWTDVLKAKFECEQRASKAASNQKRQQQQQRSEESDESTAAADGAVAATGGADVDAQQPPTADAAEYVPLWFNRYVEYKFNLLDRAGDAVIDEEEFEFALSDYFDVPPKDCRAAYRMFTQNGEKSVDLPYFRQLALQFFLSDNASDLGNFINGKLDYET